MAKHNLLIAEDHPLTRQTLEYQIKKLQNINVIGAVGVSHIIYGAGVTVFKRSVDNIADAAVYSYRRTICKDNIYRI